MSPRLANHLEGAVLALTSGFTAAGAIIAVRYTSDPGDVLGFLGGIIGAGSAVLGARWLERRKHDDAEHQFREMLGQSLLQVANDAMGALSTDDASYGAALSVVEQSLQYVEMVAASGTINDHIRALRFVTFRYQKSVWIAQLSATRDQIDSGVVEIGDARRQLTNALHVIVRTTLWLFRKGPTAYWDRAILQFAALTEERANRFEIPTAEQLATVR